MSITAASARWNGQDLGELRPSPETLLFDTSQIAALPPLVFGPANIEHPSG
jgi:hypothetical protein